LEKVAVESAALFQRVIDQGDCAILGNLA
jgi:hypothetical protein